MRSWSSSRPLPTRPTTFSAPPSHSMAPSPSPASTPRPILTARHPASSPTSAPSAAPKPTPAVYAPPPKESATTWKGKPSSSTARSSTSSAVSPTMPRATTAPILQHPRPVPSGAAFCAAVRVTSASTAPRTDGPGACVSKGRETSLYPSSSAPAPTYPLCFTTPCAAVDLPTPDVSPPFPLAFLYDVLARASYAQSLLVSDCTPDRDYPLHCFISDTLFIAEDAPHHLD